MGVSDSIENTRQFFKMNKMQGNSPNSTIGSDLPHALELRRAKLAKELMELLNPSTDAELYENLRLFEMRELSKVQPAYKLDPQEESKEAQIYPEPQES